ncbi:MAG: hypothetical protein AB7H71_14935 [Alphaproteobacteria bacterium]
MREYQIIGAMGARARPAFAVLLLQNSSATARNPRGATGSGVRLLQISCKNSKPPPKQEKLAGCTPELRPKQRPLSRRFAEPRAISHISAAKKDRCGASDA